ncbi:MAG: hypothetical protein KatS3mg013_0331 [Actinomycetota bacterium]|nr:MAG: hypothetical protein KatS3mg013_0331 [Actinomycetota bacterium]
MLSGRMAGVDRPGRADGAPPPPPACAAPWPRSAALAGAGRPRCRGRGRPTTSGAARPASRGRRHGRRCPRAPRRRGRAPRCTRRVVLRCGGLVGACSCAGAGGPARSAGDLRAHDEHAPRRGLLDVLTARRRAPTVRLTIPEGYRLTQIAAERVRRRRSGLPGRGSWPWPRAAGSPSRPTCRRGRRRVEGFLFPETYEFLREGSTARDVIRALLDQFAGRPTQLPWGNAERLGLTPLRGRRRGLDGRGGGRSSPRSGR